MNKSLLFLLTIFAGSFNLNAQTPNWDSLFKEAAKTEVYTPVPAMVTPGALPQDAPSDAIILFNGKNLDSWYGDDSSKVAGWDIAEACVTVKKKWED